MTRPWMPIRAMIWPLDRVQSRAVRVMVEVEAALVRIEAQVGGADFALEAACARLAVT